MPAGDPRLGKPVAPDGVGSGAMSDVITVNGATRDDLPSGLTVADLVAAHGLPAEGRGVAVAVDGEVVPRGQWPVHVIASGAEVELVQAIQGG